MADEQGAIPEARAPGHDEVPTFKQAIRWLAKFEHQDEVSSTTPRKIAFELAGIHSLLLATPAADRLTDTGEVLVGDLRSLRGQMQRIADLHPNDQPAYKDGVRPFGTGDLRHFIETLDAAAAALATPKPPVDAGAMRERCARVADEIAAECEEDEQACDADDRFGADRAFGGKVEPRKIAKRIRNLPDAGEPL